MTRDAVLALTPASSATSRRVGRVTESALRRTALLGYGRLGFLRPDTRPQDRTRVALGRAGTDLIAMVHSRRQRCQDSETYSSVRGVLPAMAIDKYKRQTTDCPDIVVKVSLPPESRGTEWSGHD